MREKNRKKGNCNDPINDTQSLALSHFTKVYVNKRPKAPVMYHLMVYTPYQNPSVTSGFAQFAKTRDTYHRCHVDGSCQRGRGGSSAGIAIWTFFFSVSSSLKINAITRPITYAKPTEPTALASPSASLRPLQKEQWREYLWQDLNRERPLQALSPPPSGRCQQRAGARCRSRRREWFRKQKPPNKKGTYSPGAPSIS